MKNLKERQQEILEAAIELFKEKGFVGASMRDLAAKLDIKAASLYAHIQSKEELLEWICFGIAEDFFNHLKTVEAAPLKASEKLNFFIESHLQVVLANPDITDIYSHEWKHLGGSLNHFISLRKKYQLKVEALLESIFHELHKPSTSIKFTTKFLLHTLNNSFYWENFEEKTPDEMICEIKHKVLYGLLG
ncbi:TetR/AcrR family transcriptional regulator [Elizabethkingia sp. JS20170427COW]|uniref:TetR/AcrR family transcriptional regulator n=1 Tax=Elizabethkingia sp. JS20170427COW TaxID=2583851 RepID=UPI001110A908|nr:TetR/AcrR family transcriptional regulator [Elizabethkingia sp. JS20170427COW]QCX52517.1 TetR/AcrR family transcriptional regulator [Elizabethkingia sp. JS20170427COW]